MEYSIICAGFGGQGIMIMGNLLAYAAMEENRNVTFFPSYGVEMRGGTANCTVVISDDRIGSPIVGDPLLGIFMNQPSFDKFAVQLHNNGSVFINKAFVDTGAIQRDDIAVYPVPSVLLAKEVGNERLSNLVMLGAFLKKTGIINLSSVETIMKDVFHPRYHHLIPKNIEALKKGEEYMAL